MYELKEKDCETNDFFKNGYFFVNKISVAFTATGTNSEIEQENQSMKVLGRIKGIVNNVNKLGKYFIIAPEIS